MNKDPFLYYIFLTVLFPPSIHMFITYLFSP